MAVTFFPFNSIVVDGVPDRPANANNLAAYLASFFGNGVLMHADTALQVNASSGMNLQISAGAGNINGKTILNDATETIALEAANASLSRIDRVVFRLDEANRLMEFAVLTGTPAASPTAPALTQTANVYELCLAEIRVPAGATSIVASYITDKRTASTLKGLGLIATAAELNILAGAKISTGELNILDGVTVSAAEINFLKGITSNIQTQLNSKSPKSHNHDSTYAKSNHNHDGSYLKKYDLNSINIDSTSGNWTVDISESGHGTIPMTWVNVTQTSGAHFIVQTAIKCDISSSATDRNQKMWIRDKYAQSGVWSNWKEILTSDSNAVWTKVWGNGNSESAFGGQDITGVSYSDDHNLFLCVFKSAHDAQKEFSVIARKNEESEIHILANLHSDGAPKIYARRFKINTGYQRVTFYDCSVKTVGKEAVSTDSSKLIPVAIYGCAAK